MYTLKGGLMNKVVRELIIAVLAFVLAAACAAIAVRVYARSQPGAAPAARVECTPVHYGTAYLTMDIRLPRVSGLTDPVLERALNNEIYHQIKTAARDADTQARLFYEEMSAAGFEPWLHVFWAAYDVKSDRGILSLTVTTYLENGGTGMPHTAVYNVDIAQSKRLRLCDLFLDDAGWEAPIDAVIEGAMRRDPGRYFAPYDFPGVNADTKFFVKDGTLYMLFAKYELMSGMSGEPEYAIDTKLIRPVLKPEYRHMFW